MTHSFQRATLTVFAAVVVACLAACAAHPPRLPPATPPSPQSSAEAKAEAEWQEVKLPGKRATEYTWEEFDGRRALAARSDASASMMRRKLTSAPKSVNTLNFSWQVEALITGADTSVAETEDAPVRVMLAFGGDASKLSARTRMLFELSHALTGEEPPYATLMYVWDNQAPVNSLIVNPRTDRIRKIVVDSGPEGLKRWRDHKRDVAADFRRAFGEEPGPLLAIALMTDSDNTKSKSRAWYGPLSLD
jgi:hypothetical protein